MLRQTSDTLPVTMQRVLDAARKALHALEPAVPNSPEAHRLFLASRTNGGRDLPPYYLVYFLLVDLLGFPDLGQSEKVAWAVPIRYKGKFYGIEYRKMGLGIFAPNPDPNAWTSTAPSEDAERDAREISEIIKKGVSVADPYFEWRAQQAATGVHLNVVNNSNWLFERYRFFHDRFNALAAEAEARKNERNVDHTSLQADTVIWGWSASYSLQREANWNAQAAIEAFFSWTEHVFIHLGILQGRLRTGEDIAKMAEADWKAKFKLALDVNELETKLHYDNLLALRSQIRNFMAHGAFGKCGEAFSFHSRTGAVPVLLTGRKDRFSLTGKPPFNERRAMEEIEKFIDHLWTGCRAPAQRYLETDLPTILTYVADGTYSAAMASVEEMEDFVDGLSRAHDIAADMDW